MNQTGLAWTYFFIPNYTVESLEQRDQQEKETAANAAMAQREQLDANDIDDVGPDAFERPDTAISLDRARGESTDSLRPY